MQLICRYGLSAAKDGGQVSSGRKTMFFRRRRRVNDT